MPKEPIYPLDPYPKVIINAALTGMVPTKAQTPHVPITEDEIVADALACARAGAAIAHLHIRDAEGKPDYRAEVYGRIIRRIREKSEVIICVSTSARVFQEFEQRAQVLFLEGEEKPELASLTTGSFNFPTQASVNPPEMIIKLAQTMLDRGIKPELEIFDAGMLNFAKYLDRKVQLPRPFYFNLLLGALGGMPGRPRDLSYLVQNIPEESIWSAAGVGLFQLPVNATALVKGGGVRVGLEDNIYFDYEKKIFATNEQLVKRIVHLAEELRRPVATPAEARDMLKIPARP